MPGPWKWFPAIGSPANRALDGSPSIVGRRSMRLDRRAAHRVKRLGGGSVARWRLCRIVRSWRGTMLAGFAMGKTSSCPQRRAMPRWSASGSRWPRECTPPVARGSSSTTTNDRIDRNDRAPRLWAGRPGSRASAPNLASSLLLACVGLFALPGQAQTAVFDPAAGVCGRTQQVRSAIRDKFPGRPGCGTITDAQLAAITGTLDLDNKGITALAADRGFRRADRADEAGSGQQLSVHASRRGVRAADRADRAESVRQRSVHASRRGVRRADRADGAGAERQLSVHASRRGVRRADRADVAGAERQLSVLASRRGVRRADRADDAAAAGQLSVHASRRGVRRADRAD